MINILLINQYSYPPGKSNWRRHFDLFKNFSKESYNIDVICGSFVHDRKEEILNKGEKYRLINSEGIKYHILSGILYKSKIIRMLSMVQFFFKVLFFSKKLKDKPNIIYASSPHPFNGLAGMYLARKYKCPFILEIRDLWPETWVAMGATTKKSILYKVFAYIEKVLYKNADKIVTLTANKDYYTSVGVDEKKVEIVSNGVDLAKYDSLLGEESPIKFSENKFNILYSRFRRRRLAHLVGGCRHGINRTRLFLGLPQRRLAAMVGRGSKRYRRLVVGTAGHPAVSRTIFRAKSAGHRTHTIGHLFFGLHRFGPAAPAPSPGR